MEYPAPIYRIKAFLLDYVLILITLMAFLVESVGDAPNWLRGLVFLGLVYLYEPTWSVF